MQVHRKLGWVLLALGAHSANLMAQDSTTSTPERPLPASAPDVVTAALAPAQAPAETAITDSETLHTIPVGSHEEAPTASTAKAAPANRLVEEVIVTSQKREERLQDIPIAVQAFSQEKLEALGIQTVQEIQRATPGFTVTQNAAFNLVFLRGIGSDAFLPGVDSSVPFYLDGVPLVAIMGAADSLGRVTRVEVLKGPQGTLFGRNATGGTISVVTPDPDQIFSGELKMELGTYGRRNVVGFTNIPLTDDLAFNIGVFNNSMDNTVTNSVRDGENGQAGGVPDIYGRGGRIKLRWNFLETASLDLAASYQKNSNNSGLHWQMVRPAPVPFGLILPADTDFDRTIQHSLTSGAINVAKIFSGAINWNPGPVDAKLIYANQEVTVPKLDADFDGTGAFLVDGHVGGLGGSRQFVKQNTAELQFLSNQDTPFAEDFEWAAGLFYLWSKGGFDPIVFNVAPGAVNALLPGAQAVTAALNNALAAVNLRPIFGIEGINLANYGLLKSESYSAYTQGTYHASDTIDLTAGVRYQREKRTLLKNYTSYPFLDGSEIILPLPPGDTPPLKPRQTSLRFAAQWRPFGPDSQIYASWARAFKNPTYNTVNLLGNTFGTVKALKAERVDSTELGYKGRLLDGALQLNLAAFYTDQKNPLSSNVTIISGGIANFTNAESARIRGADGDVLLLPMPVSNPGLVLTGGFSYLDAIYTKFTDGRGYDDVTGLGFGSGGASLPARDLSGKRIPRVPKTSLQGGISQRIELSDGNAVELSTDTFYTSKIYFLPQNSELSKRDPVQLFNARITYFYAPWDMEVSAYCSNITDELYVESTFVTDFGTTRIVNENPRILGLSAKINF